MSIQTLKTWTAVCDDPDCHDSQTFLEGTRSEWADRGQIWNRGQLDLHLRRTGWTLGRTVLCPTHAKGAA